MDKYEIVLRQRVLSIREVTNDMPVTLVLISQSGSQVSMVEKLAEQVGFSVVLHLPFDQDHLNNILHAHFIISSRDISKTFIPFAAETDLLLSTTNLDVKFDGSCYRILVAEDNPTNRKVIQKILERAGHHCTLAKDGEDALDKIEKKEFDAIILDMNMPGMTGVDVARIYRLMRGNMARAPVIMFSANVTTEARDESIEAGADEFLPKPIQVDSFLQTLQQLVTDFKVSGSPKNRALLPKPKNRLKLLWPTEAVLDLQSLTDLENVSKDPKFLDDLILEFISENRNLLRSLEIALSEVKVDEIKEILHTLKGSALSIGAVSLKMMCKRIEKLNNFEMGEYSSEITQEIKTVFSHLCEELERYRQLRRQTITRRD